MPFLLYYYVLYLWWKLYICYSFYCSIPFLFSGGSNINQNISLPQFDLRVNLSDNYATDYYDLSYPGVIMRIVLSRKMSFHLWQTYIPSSIFVVVAWLSTFVPPEQVPGKFYNLIVWSKKIKRIKKMIASRYVYRTFEYKCFERILWIFNTIQNAKCFKLNLL